MIDARFFTAAKHLTLEEIASLTGTEIKYLKASPTTKVHGISDFEETLPDTITFLDREKTPETIKACKALACIMTPALAELKDLPFQAILITPTPKKVFAKIAHVFFPNSHKTIIKDGVHSKWPDVTIHETAVIDTSAKIGAGTVIGPYVSIAKGVEIGKNCMLHSHVSISNALIGNQVDIHPGARIGQAGFGFAIEGTTPIDFPQLGRVIIEDDIKIGASTAIDRGTLKDTFIGQGTRIDNLVQIAHNVRLGKGCVIVSQVGIAGSTEIGDYTILAGQAGIADNLKIGSHVKIAAQSGVMRNIPDNGVVGGSPAVPIIEWRRQSVILSKLVRGEK